MATKQHVKGNRVLLATGCGGKLRSIGRVVSQTRSQFIAEAVLYDAEDSQIGRGVGAFVRSKIPLTHANGYES